MGKAGGDRQFAGFSVVIFAAYRCAPTFSLVAETLRDEITISILSSVGLRVGVVSAHEQR